MPKNFSEDHRLYETLAFPLFEGTVSNDQNVADEVQDLTWALVDEYATDEQLGRLEELLLDSGEAREVYVECMQLHAGLCWLFRPPKLKLPWAEDGDQTPMPSLDLPPMEPDASNGSEVD